MNTKESVGQIASSKSGGNTSNLSATIPFKLVHSYLIGQVNTKELHRGTLPGDSRSWESPKEAGIVQKLFP